MQVKNGELYCSSWNCYFLINISNHFAKELCGLSGKQLKNIFEVDRDSRFYCVNCGQKMKKLEEMHEVCMNCGFEIEKPTYYRIIEFNPHKS